MPILQDVLQKFWLYPEVRFLFGHVITNLVVALAVAFKEKNFDFRKLAGFLTQKLGPALLVYLAARLAGAYADLDWLTPMA